MSRHVGEKVVVMAGVTSQSCEGFVDVHIRGLGYDPFGLLEDDPGVERDLKLL